MAAAKIAKTTVKIDKSLLKAMVSAFAETALPGDNEGFDAQAAENAARFVIETGLHRKAGTAAIALDSFTDSRGRLMMRIALNNDDQAIECRNISSTLLLKIQEISLIKSIEQRQVAFSHLLQSSNP